MVRVAAVQFEPTLFRKAENTAALLRLAAEAAERVSTPLQPGPAGLVVLPEMATTGYTYQTREEIAPFVEPVPGPTTRVFARLARDKRVALVVGFPEVDSETNLYYNSAVLIGPDGELAGVYRKTHSFYWDTRWAADGDLGLPVFSGEWPGPLGMLICMDAGFFEPARVMVLNGAKVIAFPANWLRTAPSPEWRARAAENGVYLVAANRWGEERGARFAGGSSVIGPRGEVLAEVARGDGVAVAEIELGEPDEPSGPDDSSRPADRPGPEGYRGWVRRRLDLYHSLLRHPYRWPERYNFGTLGSGRFWLGALSGTGPGLSPAALNNVARRLPGEPGRRILVLPHLANASTRDRAGLIQAAKSSGAYFAAWLGRGEGKGEVLLLGPDGPRGRYRSPHRAAASGDGREAPAGQPFPVFDLPFARVGLLEPLDLLLPESTRLMAIGGADVVLASGPWPADLDDFAFLWRERAETNDIWLALSTGKSAGVLVMPSQSEAGVNQPEEVVFGEPGQCVPGPREDGAGLRFRVTGLWAETAPGTFSRRKDRVRRLRPELYKPLVGPHGAGRRYT